MIRIGQILKPGYSQKLSTREWREFTKAARNFHGNHCKCCRRKDVVTQVHHIYYDPSKEPWEYDFNDTVLLCKACHEELHKQLNDFRRFVFRNLTPQSFGMLNGALAVAVDKYDPLTFAHALAEFVSNPRLVQNHADAWKRDL